MRGWCRRVRSGEHVHVGMSEWLRVRFFVAGAMRLKLEGGAADDSCGKGKYKYIVAGNSRAWWNVPDVHSPQNASNMLLSPSSIGLGPV